MLEATGGLELGLVGALAAAALPVVVVNPRLRDRLGRRPRRGRAHFAELRPLSDAQTQTLRQLSRGVASWSGCGSPKASG